MTTLGLRGPRLLTADFVSTSVVLTRPGAYVLGRPVGRLFRARYVGRADRDLADRLYDHADEGKYSWFMWTYMPNARAAYLRECFLFHHFGGALRLDNKIHPDRPHGVFARCPHCPRMLRRGGY